MNQYIGKQLLQSVTSILHLTGRENVCDSNDCFWATYNGITTPRWCNSRRTAVWNAMRLLTDRPTSSEKLLTLLPVGLNAKSRREKGEHQRTILLIRHFSEIMEMIRFSLFVSFANNGKSLLIMSCWKHKIHWRRGISHIDVKWGNKEECKLVALSNSCCIVRWACTFMFLFFSRQITSLMYLI